MVSETPQVHLVTTCLNLDRGSRKLPGMWGWGWKQPATVETPSTLPAPSRWCPSPVPNSEFVLKEKREAEGVSWGGGGGAQLPQ